MTIEQVNMTCPCCDTAFEDTIAVSWNTYGPTTTDFNTWSMPSDIHSCPSCGFSGGEVDFDVKDYYGHDCNEDDVKKTLPNSIKQRVRQEISPHLKKNAEIPARRSYYYAALIAQWRGAEWREIGHLYLGAAWCTRPYRGAMSKEEKRYRHKAINCFKKGLSERQIREKEVTHYTYLIGEIYRRIGDEQEASAWFGRVEKAARGFRNRQWLVALAKQQKTDPQEFITKEFCDEYG